ncbi:MAG: hypothetical protein AAFQ21_06205 [Pseudomonadota bacterium]
MSILDRLSTWAEANTFSVSALALIGAAALCVVGLAILAMGLRAVAAVFGRIRTATRVRRVSRADGAGFRIIQMAAPGKATGFVAAALEDHLETFSFGAPFGIHDAGKRPSGSDHEVFSAARRRLKRSGADLIFWAERRSSGAEGLRVRGLSCAGGVSPDHAEPFVLHFSGNRRDWNDALAKVVAYGLAKNLQPSLGRPEGFRPERVKDITAVLDSLLTDDMPLTSGARESLEDDFCAGALHVADAGGDTAFVDTVIARRRARLAAGDVRSTGQTQAQLDLGRALLAQAEHTFDPVVVREGMSHLDAAIIKLRTDPTIRRAQQATDAISRAQKMLETRKRFSLNFAG